MRQYAQCLGRAFQVQDDILDVTSTDEELGKPTGSDREKEKNTFVSLLGLARTSWCGWPTPWLSVRNKAYRLPAGEKGGSMDHTGFLTGNLTLDLAIFAWFIAQVIKTLIHFVANRNLDLKRMVGSGDMPSSHSAFVCAATMSIGQVCGWRDPLFSLSAAIALVVMYDACNVRRAAGEQAKVLNYVIEHWSEMPEEMKQKKRLNENLGHTLPQVIMGALLGTVIGLAGPILL